jgi:ATP synthase F1 epsilon subunit
MSNKFTLEIISPDQTILKKETSEVIIPSYEGLMGILKDHIPLITFLRPGFITIKDEEEKRYYVEEGTVEFSNNNLLILTSSIRDLANFDKNLINDILQKAETKLNSAEISDKDRYLTAYKIDTLKEINQ